MAFITDWVRNIFIMVAAVSFVEILLPGGSLGKYVKFILSLMILAVVLYPFSLLDKGHPMALDPPLQQNDSQNAMTSPSALAAQLTVPTEPDPLSDIQTKQIQEVYQDKLQQALQEQLLSKIDGIQTVSVHIYMNNDVTKQSYGKIRKVVIQLDPAALAQQVKSFAAETLSVRRGQVQVTAGTDQTGDTGG